MKPDYVTFPVVYDDINEGTTHHLSFMFYTYIFAFTTILPSKEEQYKIATSLQRNSAEPIFSGCQWRYSIPSWDMSLGDQWSYAMPSWYTSLGVTEGMLCLLGICLWGSVELCYAFLVYVSGVSGGMLCLLGICLWGQWRYAMHSWYMSLESVEVRYVFLVYMSLEVSGGTLYLLGICSTSSIYLPSRF